MELIIIKGKSHYGKTTIAKLIHNKLTEIKNFELQWMYYDHLKFPIEEKDLFEPRVPDFRSVFQYLGKNIGIISHGDSSRYAKQHIRQMINDFHVDILIVCSSVDSLNWNMLNRDFGEYVKENNIFEVTDACWAANKSELISVKEIMVMEIINHIKQICNRL